MSWSYRIYFNLKIINILISKNSRYFFIRVYYYIIQSAIYLLLVLFFLRQYGVECMMRLGILLRIYLFLVVM